MTRWLLVWLLLIPPFLLLDYLWLGRLAQRFYLRELGPLARQRGGKVDARLPAAAVVYLLIPLGIVLFPLQLAAEGGVFAALAWGATFGLGVYGIYDFTNRAVLAGWSLRLSLVDLVWGSVLCGISTVIAYGIRAWMQ